MAKAKARLDFVRSDRVAGVSFKNTDGTRRQQIIRWFCREGMELHLRHEPSNEHDKNAVAVYVLKKGWIFRRLYQIGYLVREDARDVVKHLDAGGYYEAVIEKVFGGTRDKPIWGVAYRIECTWEGQE